MPIQYTSRLGLQEVIDQLTGLRLEVYLAIEGWNREEDGPGPTIESLARKLGRKESSICGRVNELRKAGAILQGPIVENPSTRKPAMTYIAIKFREETTHHFDKSTGQGDLFRSMQGS